NRYQPADHGDRGLGLIVVLVSVVLILGAHTLAHDHGDLVVVGGVDADRTMRVDDLEVGSSGKVLLEMIVKVVGLAEDVGEVSVIEVELVMQARPIDALQLRRDEAEDYDHDHQDNPSPPNSGGSSTLALGSLVLDQ